jgi:hypothetical protein
MSNVTQHPQFFGRKLASLIAALDAAVIPIHRGQIDQAARVIRAAGFGDLDPDLDQKYFVNLSRDNLPRLSRRDIINQLLRIQKGAARISLDYAAARQMSFATNHGDNETSEWIGLVGEERLAEAIVDLATLMQSDSFSFPWLTIDSDDPA